MNVESLEFFIIGNQFNNIKFKMILMQSSDLRTSMSKDTQLISITY